MSLMNARQVAQKTAEAMGDAKAMPAPCGWCGDMTPYSVLSALGARCTPCFHSYCEANKPTPPMSDKADPKSWAYVLRQRHRDGERLTPAQVSAYQTVLLVEVTA